MRRSLLLLSACLVLAGCPSKKRTADGARLTPPLAMIGAANKVLGRGPAVLDGAMLQLIGDHAARCKALGAAGADVSAQCGAVFEACEIGEVPIARGFEKCRAALAELDATVANAERDGATPMPHFSEAPSGDDAKALVAAADAFGASHPAFERAAPLLADPKATGDALAAACDGLSKESETLEMPKVLAPYAKGIELWYLSAEARCLNATELAAMGDHPDCTLVKKMAAEQLPASWVEKHAKLAAACK